MAKAISQSAREELLAAHATSPDEASLVARIRAGDEKAFETVVKTYYPGLCAFVLQILGSQGRPVAEEIVQDVLLAVWRQRSAWAPTQSVAAYLYGATRNGALRWRKREHASIMVQAESVRQASERKGVPTDAALEASETARAVSVAIAQLPPRCRLIFEMQRQHGLSYAQIAETLGLSPKTIEVQMGRALRALRVHLADYLPGIVAIALGTLFR